MYKGTEVEVHSSEWIYPVIISHNLQDLHMGQMLPDKHLVVKLSPLSIFELNGLASIYACIQMPHHTSKHMKGVC